MWPIVFTLLAVLALGIALNKIIKINADPKSKVTAICFLLISIINIAGYWLENLGVFTMALTVALLITGAYFTRYMQTDHQFKEE
ncbi:hypothetical protein Plano_2870 [Planococcus sp. PAMC 21323]|uniref:hypothetical protein n=1 Tax=Planococcus sp. PAMC 21323 TaxID=1526927 RepID=UPI00057188F7|nr:hypothetical protein [Planococcus sp. PAMC 21323]AIY06835.1 hypothetical protein Plano_2870 [Planococcus sp. PAMC 21323]